MAWLRTGTVSVTTGSTTVTGTGTGFAANSRVGDAFIGPDGRQYEIGNVASDTVLSILPAYLGPTAAGQAYAVMPVNGYPKLLADAVRDWQSTYGPKMAAMGTTGNYEVLPVAKGGTGGTDGATARAGIAAAKSGANSDITSLTGLTTAITAAAGGVWKGYIEGLNINWNSGTSLTISPGAAYIPSLNRTLEVPSALSINIASGSLAGDSFYFIYLYSGTGGAPALELSTTAADIYTNGTARQKSGDPSRRFLFAVRSGPGGNFLKFMQNGDLIQYQGTTNAAPYRVISGNGATAPYTAYIPGLVPITSRIALVNCHNATAGTSGPTLWITDYEFQYMLVRGIDSSTRQVLRIPLVNISFVFFFAAAGGTANFDILGYSAER